MYLEFTVMIIRYFTIIMLWCYVIRLLVDKLHGGPIVNSHVNFFFKIQSSAVITWCSIPCYYIQQDKTAVFFQTTFSIAFPMVKIYAFRLRICWSLFLRFQLTIFQHRFRLWLGTGLVTTHCLNQWWLVYWCIYASLGLSELRCYHTY